VLRGELRRPSAYPQALRKTAPDRWHGMATATLAYAKAGHAPKGALTQVAGAMAVAATQTAHAARGEWVTNEKGLLERAGLREVDAFVGNLIREPDALARAVVEAETLFSQAVDLSR
jgi:hypothetical protein